MSTKTDVFIELKFKFKHWHRFNRSTLYCDTLQNTAFKHFANHQNLLSDPLKVVDGLKESLFEEVDDLRRRVEERQAKDVEGVLRSEERAKVLRKSLKAKRESNAAGMNNLDEIKTKLEVYDELKENVNPTFVDQLRKEVVKTELSKAEMKEKMVKYKDVLIAKTWYFKNFLGCHLEITPEDDFVFHFAPKHRISMTDRNASDNPEQWVKLRKDAVTNWSLVKMSGDPDVFDVLAFELQETNDVLKTLVEARKYYKAAEIS